VTQQHPLNEQPQLTEQQIEERTCERDALVESLKTRAARYAGEPVAIPEAPKNADSTASRLKSFQKSDGEAIVLHEAARREKVDAIVAPITAGVNAVIAQYTAMRAAHYDDVLELANMDLNAVLPAVPLVVEPDGLSTNRQRIVMLTRTAHELEASLKHDADVAFQDLKRELASLRLMAERADPDKDVDFKGSVTRINGQIIASGPNLGYLRRAQAQIENITRLIRSFVAQKQRVDEMLAGVERLPVAAREKRETLPALPAEKPRAGTSSFVEFDPRTDPAPKTPGDVTKLEGGGTRIGRDVPEWNPKGKVKVVD
jgi:hypothetical protein